MQDEDTFTSIIADVAHEARKFGRTSLPDLSAKELPRRVTSADALTMATTFTSHTSQQSPVASPANSLSSPPMESPCTPIPMAKKDSKPTPAPPSRGRKKEKPPQTFYGACPERNNHSGIVCGVCGLTAEQYRLERLRQSRSIYGQHSKDFVRRRLSRQSSPTNFVEEPEDERDLNETISAAEIRSRLQAMRIPSMRTPTRLGFFPARRTNSNVSLISSVSTSSMSGTGRKAGPLPKFVDTTKLSLSDSIKARRQSMPYQ